MSSAVRPGPGSRRPNRMLTVGATLATVVFLAILGSILAFAVVWLFRGPIPDGMLDATVGTLALTVTTIAISLPVGVAAATALHELGDSWRWTKPLDLFVSSMASLPSIIYGLTVAQILLISWGLGGFVTAVVALGLMVAPFVYVATREALRDVPRELRESGFALGANRWQCFRQIVLPIALPGILTGSILSVSKVAGETAVLLIIASLISSQGQLGSPPDALPLALTDFLRATPAALPAASAALIVLLLITLVLNSVAIYVRGSRRIDV